MKTYNRRAFLKHSAMLTAAAAAGRSALASAEGEAASGRAAGDSPPHDVGGERLLSTAARGQSPGRGANHPFFTRVKNRPEVIAHQGGKGQWPGNTMFAFERAVKLGVDVLELDVHSTSDGALVLMHNESVDETTDGTGRVRRFTLKNLKKLDAGYRWHEDGTDDFRYRGKGITVPTLEEVFQAFPRMRMNIEIKQSEPSIVAPLCEMIARHGMTEKVLVASFSHEVLRDVRRRCPALATSASLEELLEFRLGRTSIVERPSRPDALQMWEQRFVVQLLTQRFIDRARRESVNLPVHAWTVNGIDGMRRVIRLGVDGIITDYPGPLLALLERIASA